ncbi:hypothetical protein BS78_10G165300 [Paspalum vaginatum]|nr:hypothetical protein BS78_10G165300 [Paspalum vaginatum]
MASLYLVHRILLLSLVLNFHLMSNCEIITRDSEKTELLDLEHNWGNPVSLKWSSIRYTDHCNWSGIICTDGFVTGISLSAHGLDKPIPPAICSFKNLSYIDLSHNHISGTFPTSLFNCSKLWYLDLSDNAFNGVLPANIHQLSLELAYLNLASNGLFGSIPCTIGQLYGLQRLYLDNNNFNGSYPAEIGHLLKLHVLSLAYNCFAPARMHPQFGNLRNLKYLWMNNMNILGEIPETMSQLSQLRHLDLSSNRLNGKIPSGVWRLRSLQTLYLDNNSLCGQISGPIEAMNLTKINVSNNHLSGLIPKGIALLPMLHDMQFSCNFLSGELPKELGKHSILLNIEISSNNLSGKLPEGLCSFQALQHIDFSNNSLSGELPESLVSCSSLRSIFLYKNIFSGSFPAGIWLLPVLTMIMIQENGFSGSLPSKLGSNITTINISNNKFYGSLPISADNLHTLMAENNFISGEIPTNLILRAPLGVILLAENMLSGLLPSRIWYMHCLKELDLRKNNLSGEIPEVIGDFMLANKVDTIDLSENNLSGPIPENLARLEPNLLNLSSNHLTGQIPSTFQIKRYERSFLSNPGLCSTDSFGNFPLCVTHPEGPKKQDKHLKKLIIIFLILGSSILVCTGILCFIKIRASLTKKKPDAPSARWKLTTFQPIGFNVPDVLCGLTSNNLVGSGGSGKVYKICFTNSNCTIAVKKMCNGLRQNDILEKQFQAEIETLGSIRHANIVKLLGCISSSESKLLIYEYMEHGSLFDWLHRRDLTSTTERLNWPTRMSIAIDAARGLTYMHHDCSPPIAHRDVKSSNILLDLEFKATIADFGLARALVKAGEPESVSVAVGSFGYMAPEFGSTRKINEKVDVYSFGVVLLELTTGRRATGEVGGHENLAQWAWRKFQEESFQLMDVIDKNIQQATYFREVQMVFKLGLICTGTKPSLRPMMKEVLQVLQR